MRNLVNGDHIRQCNCTYNTLQIIFSAEILDFININLHACHVVHIVDLIICTTKNKVHALAQTFVHV